MDSQSFPYEKLVTIKFAAANFGLPYWKLQRAVRAEIIPSYTPFNSRHLVLLSEVDRYIRSTRSGGAK